MSGLTISEKILSRASGRPVRSSDIAICTPDLAMGTDASIPMALDYLGGMLARNAAPRLPQRLVFALDHYGESSGPKAQSLQEQVRAYALKHEIALYDAAQGIGHQLILESGAAQPGMLIVGADSHSTSYGAVNAFATGIGSSDLAGIFLCGALWLKVPQSIRVVLHGALRSDVSAKDIALWLTRQYGAEGASYKALEFVGPGVAQLGMDDRIVLSNMSVELGAKAGLFPFDQVTAAWLQHRSNTRFEPVSADKDASYADSFEVDLSTLVPQVALPHRVDKVVDADQVPYTAVNMVYLGTCTGGRVKDYQEALSELQRGGAIAPGVRVIVTPASEAVRAELEHSGMLAAFTALGAEIQAPGCGSCCGTCGAIPRNGETVISTANRNFKGRMGNPSASIYLASARVCAAAAVRGSIGTRPGQEQ